MRRRYRPPRLRKEAYLSARAVDFTISVDDRQSIFTNPEIYEAHVDFLRRAATEFHCNVPVFCFMPDHIHILVRAREDIVKGQETKSDILGAITKFKLLSGLWLNRKHLPKLQEGFYDRVVRYDSWRDHARYIVMNPVRAGLVTDYLDYPFTGSLDGPVSDVWKDP